MPQKERISNIVLKPLLEDHNKIASLITQLDKELNNMIDSDDPDTAFIELSIILLNENINHYHRLESYIVSHFQQYKLNIEEKLKVMTLFKEHRQSLPLLEKLIAMQQEISETNAEDLNTKLCAIRDVCDALHILLHELGKKYFSNVLVDDENHLKENKPKKIHHLELDIDGEIITDDIDAFEPCTIIDLCEDGLSIFTKAEYSCGDHISIRCNLKCCPVFNCEVCSKDQRDDGDILHLQILNFAECGSVIKNLLDHDSVV